jgi:anaerobic magnesium-protoporphyrin IX monomethyl ester cyclase
MRICLVRLPSSFLIQEKAFPPLGLMAVATSLSMSGHDVIIHDGDMADVPLDYEAYGFGPTTPEYSYALAVRERVKQVNPSVRCVLGGSFAALNLDRCKSDGWDCIVIGDGEAVANEAFIGTKSIIYAEERPLDEYAITRRTMLDIKAYQYYLGDRLTTTLITSRGCPWRCAFCCKPDARNTVRMRSAGHVIREIGYLYDEFGYGAFAFVDDIFILNRKRTEEIAAALKYMDIKWRCLVRADLVVQYGKDFIRMMVDSGCTDLAMGIESGSDKILKTINKGEDIATIKTAINMLHDEGMRVKGFFILGLPSETRETLAETDKFLTETKLDDVDIKIYQPYPGSPIWNNKKDLDIDWHDMELNQMFYKGRMGEYYGNISTSNLTNAEISQAMSYMEGKYKRAC